MDNSFTFPRPQAPIPRPAPTHSSPASPVNRESNALRASVLDVALQLGIGSNSLVADWMFNNSLTEEDEEPAGNLAPDLCKPLFCLRSYAEVAARNTFDATFHNSSHSDGTFPYTSYEQRSPALTYGSTATSEESSFSGGIARFPSTSSSSHASSNPKSAQAPDANLFAVPEGQIHFDKSADIIPARPSAASAVPFPEIPVPPRPVTPVAPARGKLRKKRGDGYESDGGYISDAGKKKKDKDKKQGVVNGSQADIEVDKKERAKEAKSRAKEEKLQEKREKEEERKRKKSFGKAKKSQGEDKDGYATGYETDASKSAKSSKKSKSKTSGDAGHETDSGYLSSTPGKTKSKTRFFKLGSKQSRPELRQEEVPALPTTFVEKEPVPLPIASKFATTVKTAPLSASASLANVSARTMDPLPMSSPPLSSPTTTSLHSPTSPTRGAPDHRESFASAESGGSASASSANSHSKRRGFQFFSRDPAPDKGSGSFSTSTSPLQTAPPLSAVNSPILPNVTFASISLPLTHASSTSPTSGGHPPVNTSMGPSSQQPSPLSTSSSSPQTLTPPVISNSRNPSPAPGLNVPRPQFQVTSTTPSPTLSKSPSVRVRPRFPPTDGFGPRPTPASPLPPSPSSFLRSPSPNPNPRIQGSESPYSDRPTLTIVPSTDYIVPSPRASPLPSPNVLAYYDIPPPSPPPAGPLPSVPPPGSFPRTPTRGQGGGSISSLARSRTPEQGLFSQPIPSIQRGREAPFPARPIMPLPAGASGSAGVGQGLEARVKVPRYRELYGLALPPRETDRRASPSPMEWERERGQEDRESHMSRMDIEVVEPSDGGWDDVGYDEQDEEDMRDVLERFEEARMDAEGRGSDGGGGGGGRGGKALGRSRSFEAIRSRISGGRSSENNSDSEYNDEEFDDEEVGRKSSTEEGGDRNSRWSGSIYSRVSVLDPEKSEEARQRFVQRVEAMYGDGGREKVIPPVPKLPDAYIGVGAATPGRSWNRF
ncbi:hypothetical protein D9615_008278 [Tricholomella constricta]|uniref:Uncharacterized protein n=1 Tax=Tricholomella constricta TaxID=117010 RepID=A0A8H5H370_9AGAR|nr:hypothetical protein D9615_008278 [Tricholomella constricta]